MDMGIILALNFCLTTLSSR